MAGSARIVSRNDLPEREILTTCLPIPICASLLAIFLLHPIPEQIVDVPIFIPFIKLVKRVFGVATTNGLDFGAKIIAQVLLTRNVCEKMADI